MVKEPSAQSHFQKLNFGNSSQKIAKNRYQSLVVLSNITGFVYFIPNVLSKNVVDCHCVKNVQKRRFSWSVFSCIWTEYGDLRKFAHGNLLHKFSYSVRIQENTDQKKTP